LNSLILALLMIIVRRIFYFREVVEHLHLISLLMLTEFDFMYDPAIFDFSFEFRLRVSLTKDGNLSLVSRIRNVNGKPFSFSFGYHTYLSVSDIRSGISPNILFVLQPLFVGAI
jgi:galactose mutarotase-like enzyme